MASHNVQVIRSGITGFELIMRNLLAAFLILCAGTASANDYPWSISLETGAVWQNRNDVRIPGDTGTQFSISDITSRGPFAFYRLEYLLNLSERQQLRFLIAPFRFSESGVPDKDIFFVDETFNAGRKTDFTYQFNSYRVSYRYLYQDKPSWRLWLGGTAKIRDAEIALRQGNVKVKDSNVGFVPLFNLYSDYKLNDKWRFIVDFDGLVGRQGRAIDLGLKLHYDIDKHWYLGAGYRTLEGGADNDDVYNFAWLNYALVSVGYRH
jgi:hypothetical protein